MNIKLSLHVNNSYAGHKEYSIRDEVTFVPAQRVLEDFTQSAEDYFAGLPNSGLSPIEVFNFLRRDRSYKTKRSLTEDLKYYKNKDSELRNKNFLLRRELANTQKECERRLARYKRTDKLYKRHLKKLAKPAIATKATPTTKYYDILAVNSWIPIAIGISFGKTAEEAIARYKHYYNCDNYKLSAVETKNPYKK